MTLTSRFDQALHYATLIHAGQTRKGTEIPYVAHLLGVTSIALEYGANEDEAIGALLHDAAEDAGGEGRIADIRQRFGDDVAEVVQGCTDAVVVPKPPWRERKEDYIAHVPQASASVRLVSAADKLHNARAILRDHRQLGEALWAALHRRQGRHPLVLPRSVTAFRKAGSDELIDELDRVVSEIEELAAQT